MKRTATGLATMGKLLVALVAFAIVSPAGAAAGAPQPVDVFVSGQGGYHTYRIPALLRTSSGTLLAFCEGRKNDRRDHGDIDLLLRRSHDGGRTWGEVQLVHEEGGTARITIGNPCPVLDESTGIIWLSFCRDNDDVFITSSADDGATWAEPRNITRDVKRSAWGWYATGPGHGIQLKQGPHAGRLVMPCDFRVKGAKGDKEGRYSHVIYSDDHGQTWQLGGISDEGMNECEVVELADGRLLLSMRNYLGTGTRAFAHSDDGGLSWSPSTHEPAVYCPVCQSSIARLSHASSDGENRLLYTGPGGPNRTNLTVRLSTDEGRSWPVARVLHEGPAAYSDLAALGEGAFGVLYEAGREHSYETIKFARCTLPWVTGKDAASEE